MELGSQHDEAFAQPTLVLHASAQPTLVLHLLIDYISHFTFLVFLQEPAQTLSVFLGKMMTLEPSVYCWLPHNKKGRSNTNVWLHRSDVLLLQGIYYAEYNASPLPSELRVEFETREYVLMKSFAATDPIDGVKQVKCNCSVDTTLFSCTHVIVSFSLPCFHVSLCPFHYLVFMYTCHCVLFTTLFSCTHVIVSFSLPCFHVHMSLCPFRVKKGRKKISDMHVSVTCKCFSMCYHYAIPTPLDYCLQIMMLAVNIQLFTASLQRLQMSRNQAHEWSNSVGKKFFQRLLEAVAPHYNLWVYVVHYYPYIIPDPPIYTFRK